MSGYRAQRIWHIETRNGYFYATNQYGGFTRYGTRAEAVDAIDKDVDAYGDRWLSLHAWHDSHGNLVDRL